jgi:hypothetical protein
MEMLLLSLLLHENYPQLSHLKVYSKYEDEDEDGGELDPHIEMRFFGILHNFTELSSLKIDIQYTLI